MKTNVTINYSDPVWKSGRSAYLGKLDDQIESYSDTTVALGGYDNASFSINDAPINVEDWIESGLGRHIDVFGAGGDKHWEGFVNDISVSLGPLSFTLGPLLDVSNYVKAKYQDFSTGTSEVTAYSSDTASQALFGIRARVLTVGSVSATSAASILATYLNENKYPKTSQSLGDAAGPTLTVNCLGYYHVLNYVYNTTGVEATATYTLREKLIEILDAEPNNLLNSDPLNITANTLSVFQYENEDKLAWDLIKELVAMGSATGNSRMLFGIYEGRKAKYNIVPTSILYTQRLDDVGVNLQTKVGGHVDPWDVKVGEWVQFTDFLVGRNLPSSTFQQDPRIMLIESVTYTAPYGIEIAGGNADNLPQQLAKLGLGGI